MYSRISYCFGLIYYSIQIDFCFHIQNNLYTYNFDIIAACIPVHLISTCLYSKPSQCSKEGVWVFYYFALSKLFMYLMLSRGRKSKALSLCRFYQYIFSLSKYNLKQSSTINWHLLKSCVSCHQTKDVFMFGIKHLRVWIISLFLANLASNHWNAIKQFINW